MVRGRVIVQQFYAATIVKSELTCMMFPISYHDGCTITQHHESDEKYGQFPIDALFPFILHDKGADSHSVVLHQSHANIIEKKKFKY